MRGKVPPCQAACPAFTDVQGYVSLAALGRFGEAYDVARLTNPFATSCGYVCFHPCEQNCRRGDVDEPVSIMELKRAAATFGGNRQKAIGNSKEKEEQQDELSPNASRLMPTKKVAVIGAGPAGLTAAQDLAQAGRDVTVFEREAKAGGMLRLTIPNYRLPDAALDRDISLIEQAGVAIEYGRELGKDLKLAELRKKFDAVVVATGLPESRSLPVFPSAGHDVMLAIPFLKAVKAGNPPELKDNVIVVGGGNVAIDVARSAVRLGSHVELVCLESRDEMPAHDWEIAEAAEEGVGLNCCFGPSEVLSDETGISALKCQAVASVFDAEGRFNPTFIDDKFTEVSGETIIIAIGQAREPIEGLEEAPENVFTAGEFATGPGSAIQAVQSGHLAAARAEAYLSGNPEETYKPEKLSELTERMRPLVPARARIKAEARNPETRAKDFNLFEPGLAEIAAVREALRCMACLSGAVVDKDKCIACLTCVRVCPFEIPLIGNENVAVIDEVECQACGQCATECPASAITLSRGQVERLLEDAARVASANKEVEIVCQNRLLEGDAAAASNRIPVTCAAQVSELVFYKALEAGAAKIVVAMCPEGGCYYGDARERLLSRIESVKETLSGLGLNPDSIVIRE